LHGFVMPRHQPVVPMAACPDVVFPPALDVVHLETMPLQIGGRHADAIQFAARRNISGQHALFAGTAAEALVVPLGRTSNRMMQVQPARFQQPFDRGEIREVIGQSNMLEHTD
jgi:hypothetical protein